MSQRIAVIGTGFTPQGNKAPPAPIAAVAGADFTPELVETRYSVFPGTPYDRGLAALGYVDCGIKAAADGYDGIFINTFGDYGIAELRSAVSIPVVGAGEAAMAVASTLGRRFAIVTIWPTTLRFIFDERIAATGMASRCMDVISVLAADEMRGPHDADNPVAHMRAGKTAVLDRIVQAAEGAMARGADTIVLGCTCMAPIASQIAARLPVPVVDPMATGYKFTETMVGLRLAQSAVAYPRTASDRLAAVDKLLGGGALPESDPDCDVCVIAAE